MTTYTSTQNGNWSAAATWGGGGTPGIGDTATIAHTVTIDVDTTVGTSPNDTSTLVVTVNNTKSLVIATSKTLTIRGNASFNFNSNITLNAGANIVFDNSVSGGTPIYNLAINFILFTASGTSGLHCQISAIAGQTFTMGGASGFQSVTATYLYVSRMATSTWGVANAGAISFTFCLFDSCGIIIFSNASTTNFNFTINDCVWTNTTGSAESIRLQLQGVLGTGARSFRRNVVDKFVNHNAVGFEISDNYLGGSINCIAGKTWSSFRRNFCITASINTGNGALMTASAERNYFVIDSSSGNPHFTSPTALDSADNIVSQNIYEAHTPDLIDAGDCILVKDAACSGGFKVIGKNNIVLPDSYPSVSCTSGDLLTLYNASSAVVTQWTRNTGCINKDVTQGRGALIVTSEAGNGTAGQVEIFKSNLAWGSTANQAWLVERNAGNVKDIVSVAGADKNWRYNSSNGDNQRGYEDRAASNTLWTAGDAVAAGVDANQGSGNPQFVDSSRNIASWAVARGLGSDYATGLTALSSDPTRTADLIDYVFEGFKVQNASMRTAAHDGGAVGAANYHKSTRTLAAVNSFRTAANTRYGISV
jgi:hypothetical protein